jgi:hypothetical protein
MEHPEEEEIDVNGPWIYHVQPRKVGVEAKLEIAKIRFDGYILHFPSKRGELPVSLVPLVDLYVQQKIPLGGELQIAPRFWIMREYESRLLYGSGADAKYLSRCPYLLHAFIWDWNYIVRQLRQRRIL